MSNGSVWSSPTTESMFFFFFMVILFKFRAKNWTSCVLGDHKNEQQVQISKMSWVGTAILGSVTSLPASACRELRRGGAGRATWCAALRWLDQTKPVLGTGLFFCDGCLVWMKGFSCNIPAEYRLLMPIYADKSFCGPLSVKGFSVTSVGSGRVHSSGYSLRISNCFMAVVHSGNTPDGRPVMHIEVHLSIW